MRRELWKSRMLPLMTTIIAVGMLLCGTTGVASAEPVDQDGGDLRFDIGNGITGYAYEDTRSMRLTTPVPLVFDSRVPSGVGGIREPENLYGFGHGWTFDTPFVLVEPGTSARWLLLPEVPGYFEIDPRSPSGLRGYTRTNLRADFVGVGVLPGRGDVPEREYSWTLTRHDTRHTEYFSPGGDLIASIEDVSRARTDWLWEDGDGGGRGHLTRLVDAAGGVTQLESDWVNGRHTLTMPSGEVIFVGTDPAYQRMTRMFRGTQRTYFFADGWSLPTRIVAEESSTVYPLEHLFMWEFGDPTTLRQAFKRVNPELGWQLVWQAP